MPSLESVLNQVREISFFELGPGPRLLPIRYIINLFKTGTLFYCMYLMKQYNNPQNELANYIYTGMHGSYGMIWLAKDILFGDPTFRGKARLTNLIILSGVLTLYWMIPYWRITHPDQGVTNNTILVALLMYILGVVLMIASDCQKYYILQNKKGLIDYGCFARTRNPNYLGEMMLYGGFAMMCPDKRAWAVLAFMWSTLFAMNMTLKEISFMKKQGYKEYKSRSHFLLPQILPWKLMDLALWGALAAGVAWYNQQK